MRFEPGRLYDVKVTADEVNVEFTARFAGADFDDSPVLVFEDGSIRVWALGAEHLEAKPA